MKLREAVGRQIRKFRKDARLTQRQLAEKLGRQTETISAIERGLNMPSEDTLIGLSQVFSIPVYSLFQGFDTSDQDQKRQMIITEIINQCQTLTLDELNLTKRQVQAIRPPDSK